MSSLTFQGSSEMFPSPSLSLYSCSYEIITRATMKFQLNCIVLAKFLLGRANRMASPTTLSMRAGWALFLYLSPGFLDFKSIHELNPLLPQIGIVSPLLDLPLPFAYVPSQELPLTDYNSHSPHSALPPGTPESLLRFYPLGTW